jgi:hypothetical protein
MGTEDLVRIAEAGDGFRIDAAGRFTDDLVRIADAGGGSVVFEGLWLRRKSL